MGLYGGGDYDRALKGSNPTGHSVSEPYRSEFRRDYARLIHCAAFRRLNGKTQLFPGFESDFFRNRLTHSMEVAQIAKSIATKLNYEQPFLKEQGAISLDLVEVAALAHDLGHPPFGHNGELALDRCMIEHGGFEGNAQTLRIVSVLEKKSTDDLGGYGVRDGGEDRRYGLDLCARTLAAVLKYDTAIRQKRSLDGYQRPTKGYYASEAPLVAQIKRAVLGEYVPSTPFKTIECQIMDVADDIAYSTYDLEDAFKAEFLSPLALLSAENSLLQKVSDEINRSSKGELGTVAPEQVRAVLLRVFEEYLKDDQITELLAADNKPTPDTFSQFLARRHRALTRLAKVGYARTAFTSDLVGQFIAGIKFEPNPEAPALSRVYLNNSTRLKVEVLKQITYVSLIMSPRLKLAEYRGQEIVQTLFDKLTTNNGHVLLPDDFRQWYDRFANDDTKRKRVVCDFIAGMTDRYAVEFYARLRSESPETIFKPI